MATRWYPITCQCVIDFDNNANVTNVVKRCEIHREIKNDTDLFYAVREYQNQVNVQQGIEENDGI